VAGVGCLPLAVLCKQRTAITQFPYKVSEKKRDNDLLRQKNHPETKNFRIFISKSNAMSFFFGYFARATTKP